MAAVPRYALVALALPEVRGATCQQWVQRLASGMAVAAQQTNTALYARNLSRGPLAISVSVHGEVEAGRHDCASTAAAGERVYVSGPLGSAAACVRTNQLLPVTADALTAQQHAYYRPAARLTVAQTFSLPPAQLIYRMVCCRTWPMYWRPAVVEPSYTLTTFRLGQAQN